MNKTKNIILRVNLFDEKLIKIKAKQTAKKNEELSKEIKSNLNQFYQSFFTKLNKTDLKLDDREAKQTIDYYKKVSENAQKGVNLTYFAYWLILVSVLSLGISFYTFYLNSKTRDDIRNEYQQELIKIGQYNSEKNANFLEKFRYWIDKNPKDSQLLNNSIEAYWKKK